MPDRRHGENGKGERSDMAQAWFEMDQPIRIVCGEAEHSCVRLAAQDLLSDLSKVSGQETVLCLQDFSEPNQNEIRIETLGLAHVQAYLEREGISASGITGCPEHYMIVPEQSGMTIIGSDKRGTMWGIYDYAQRFLGVDPLYLWTDHEPARLERVPVPVRIMTDGLRGFRYRGWFINDEDLIQGFCKKGRADKDYRLHRDYGEMLDMIIETALRLKQNMLIPCSHLDIMKPEEEAVVRRVTERGLYVTMHHIEPVGVDQRTVDAYWSNRGVKENVNYFDHPHRYYEVWHKYIERWAQYDGVIWQLGLRGRGDRPVWHQNDRIPDSRQMRGQLVSDAIAAQLEIVKAHYPAGKEILSTTTLWMEGMPLYRAGALTIPKGTMIIQSDFGPNQMWGEGYQETPRYTENRYGLYYHLAFWGCGPHLIQGNRPEKIRFNFRQALGKGDTEYVILNVSNFREFVYGVYYEARLTWNLGNDDVTAFRRTWCREQFETEDTTELEAVYERYYQCFASMDDASFPAQMTFNDGMARRVAMKLMEIIRGSELIPEDIQNKRLYSFESADAFIDYYKRATQEGMARFRELHEQALGAVESIPAHRRRFFAANMLAQTEIILGLYNWVNALCHAAENRRSGGSDKDFARIIGEAAFALEQAISDRGKAEFGRFAHWYENDRLMNLDELRQMTAALLQH